MIELRDVDFSYGTIPVLSGVSARFEEGCFYGIFGPNGGGKSTLLRLLTGELAPSCGRVSPEWKNVEHRARRIAFCEQEVPSRIPLTVREVVALGRYPWRRSAENSTAVEEALEKLELLPLADRSYCRLSGGERQRVMLARALAQETPTLLLDEPGSSLDAGRLHHFYRILRRLAKEGRCVVMVSHDLFVAPSYLDSALLLDDGKIVYSGIPAGLFPSDSLTRVFRLPVNALS